MALKSLFDVAAPAKLNLFLHIVGRRADGYHLLQSIFVLIDWCDRLHFECRGDGRLARHDLGTALPADDLCLRAARALQAASGSPLGADISIDKQVPWGAGLGGGRGAALPAAAADIPAGTFTGGTQFLRSVASNRWVENCLSFRYANRALVPAGTFSGRATYTLTAP